MMVFVDLQSKTVCYTLCTHLYVSSIEMNFIEPVSKTIVPYFFVYYYLAVCILDAKNCT